MNSQLIDFIQQQINEALNHQIGQRMVLTDQLKQTIHATLIQHLLQIGAIPNPEALDETKILIDHRLNQFQRIQQLFGLNITPYQFPASIFYVRKRH